MRYRLIIESATAKLGLARCPRRLSVVIEAVIFQIHLDPTRKPTQRKLRGTLGQESREGDQGNAQENGTK